MPSESRTAADLGDAAALQVPDSERNQAWLGRCSHGGYPQLELMTLVETGTPAVIGAVFGPPREGETSYATRLLHHLTPGSVFETAPRPRRADHPGRGNRLRYEASPEAAERGNPLS